MVAGLIWPRFYQIPTNMPIVGDRNKKIYNLLLREGDEHGFA